MRSPASTWATGTWLRNPGGGRRSRGGRVALHQDPVIPVLLQNAFDLLRHEAELSGEPSLADDVVAGVGDLDIEKLQQPVCEFDMLPGPKDVELDAGHALERLNHGAEFDDLRSGAKRQQDPQLVIDDPVTRAVCRFPGLRLGSVAGYQNQLPHPLCAHV